MKNSSSCLRSANQAPEPHPVHKVRAYCRSGDKIMTTARILGSGAPIWLSHSRGCQWNRWRCIRQNNPLKRAHFRTDTACIRIFLVCPWKPHGKCSATQPLMPAVVHDAAGSRVSIIIIVHVTQLLSADAVTQLNPYSSPTLFWRRTTLDRPA
jgi:hypothetical protein